MANSRPRGSGVASEVLLFTPIREQLNVFRMSASHTTPNPSTGLASGGVPTEA